MDEPRASGWVRLHRRTVAQFKTLLHEHADPAQMGWAVALGVMVGCCPFFGFHTALAVGLAMLFRVNRLAVLLGSHVSSLPFTPFLLFANAQVGSWVLHRRWLALSFSELRHTSPKVLAQTLLLDLFVGGLVVGCALAGLLGTLTVRWVARRQARSRPAAP